MVVTAWRNRTRLIEYSNVNAAAFGQPFFKDVGDTVKKVSLVVPVFNEEDNLHEFYKRATSVMQAEAYDYSIVFVDDGSRDASRVILNELAKQDEHVEAYLLSRNYGHQMALTCGLDNADGDAIITMDGDLQHPPELIPELLRLWEAGNEIVQTKRMATEDAGFFKNITSHHVLPKEIVYSSLCYAVGPHCLSILNVIVCVY